MTPLGAYVDQTSLLYPGLSCRLKFRSGHDIIIESTTNSSGVNPA